MAVQEFISPTSLSEAQQAVGDGAASSWLAGGTDLLVGIRLGARDPARVIDLKQIPELTAPSPTACCASDKDVGEINS